MAYTFPKMPESRLTGSLPTVTPKAFHQADSFELHQSQANNLVYGHDIHVCPGKPLAQLELGLLVECLAEQVSKIRPASDDYFDHAIYPASGSSRLAVMLS